MEKELGGWTAWASPAPSSLAAAAAVELKVGKPSPEASAAAAAASSLVCKDPLLVDWAGLGTASSGGMAKQEHS